MCFAVEGHVVDTETRDIGRPDGTFLRRTYRIVPITCDAEGCPVGGQTTHEVLIGERVISKQDE